MNYVLGSERRQVRIECIEEYVDADNEVRVIADFRKDNIDALTKVFETFVDFCIELGLYGKELIAVDGTKLEASASKRKHYSKNKLSKMEEIVQAQVNEYMHDLEKNDLLDVKEVVKFEKERIQNAIELRN